MTFSPAGIVLLTSICCTMDADYGILLLSSNKVSTVVRQHISAALKKQGTQPKQNVGSLMCVLTQLKAALYPVFDILSSY